jgi:glycerophosphoryl diester phosphodiesterase
MRTSWGLSGYPDRPMAQRSFLGNATPLAFAHRGGGGDAPENTLPAFEGALALGYRYLETDVQLTRDGVLLAFHDDRLDRLTDRTGTIPALTYAEVRDADAGYAFSPDGGQSFPFRSRGIVIPTLEDLLTRWDDVYLNIDAKTDETVAPLVALISRLDAFGRVCIGSFSDRRVARIRALASGRICSSMGQVATGTAFLMSRSGRMPGFHADCLQVPKVWGILRIDRRFVKAAHRAGLPVHVWTIDDEADMDYLLDLGVDGIMTDRPRVLKEVFQRRNLW